MTQTITPIELNRLLASEPDCVLIDVRTPLEYSEVHVPQTQLFPLDDLSPHSLVDDMKIPRDKPFYIFCRSGGRASKAAEGFEKAGFSNAVVVTGGTQAWIDAGLPVERSGPKIISLERQVRIAAGAIVLTGVLLGFFAHSAFFGLSGFVGAGLIFAGITDWCGMGLLIAKAPWNRR